MIDGRGKHWATKRKENIKRIKSWMDNPENAKRFMKDCARDLGIPYTTVKLYISNMREGKK